jgi:hypothetical protein
MVIFHPMSCNRPDVDLLALLADRASAARVMAASA